MTGDGVFLGVSLKMYLDHAATMQWLTDVVRIADAEPGVTDGRVQLAVLPGFVSLDAAIATTRGTRVEIGAQDLSWADAGAFTGEVSGRDLARLGCRYVEVGHAERRRLFGEDDTIVSEKLAAAVRNGLTPILCVGEQDQLDVEDAATSCREQVSAALRALRSAPAELIVAYEPVWAIGAERPAGPDHIRGVCRRLRDVPVGEHRPQRVRVIYGGSAGPGLLSQLGDATDGLFLGRYAHDPAALRQVITEAAAVGRG